MPRYPNPLLLGWAREALIFAGADLVYQLCRTVATDAEPLAVPAPGGAGMLVVACMILAGVGFPVGHPVPFGPLAMVVLPFAIMRRQWETRPVLETATADVGDARLRA